MSRLSPECRSQFEKLFKYNIANQMINIFIHKSILKTLQLLKIMSKVRFQEEIGT